MLRSARSVYMYARVVILYTFTCGDLGKGLFPQKVRQNFFFERNGHLLMQSDRQENISARKLRIYKAAFQLVNYLKRNALTERTVLCGCSFFYTIQIPFPHLTRCPFTAHLKTFIYLTHLQKKIKKKNDNVRDCQGKYVWCTIML